MNLESFEALVASLVFDKLPKETQELLTSIISALVETATAEGSWHLRELHLRLQV